MTGGRDLASSHVTVFDRSRGPRSCHVTVFDRSRDPRSCHVTGTVTDIGLAIGQVWDERERESESEREREREREREALRKRQEIRDE